MIQDFDHAWNQPYPLPLVSQPLAGQDVVLPPEDEGAESAALEKNSLAPETPPEPGEDGYQWMLLL